MTSETTETIENIPKIMPTTLSVMGPHTYRPWDVFRLSWQGRFIFAPIAISPYVVFPVGIAVLLNGWWNVPLMALQAAIILALPMPVIAFLWAKSFAVARVDVIRQIGEMIFYQEEPWPIADVLKIMPLNRQLLWRSKKGLIPIINALNGNDPQVEGWRVESVEWDVLDHKDAYGLSDSQVSSLIRTEPSQAINSHHAPLTTAQVLTYGGLVMWICLMVLFLFLMWDGLQKGG